MAEGRGGGPHVLLVVGVRGLFVRPRRFGCGSAALCLFGEIPFVLRPAASRVRNPFIGFP